MIRRPPRSTLSSSSAASDVYKRQVLHRVAPRVVPHEGTSGVPHGQQQRQCEQRCHDPGSRSPYSALILSLIHISEPTRLLSISYAVFCLKKKKKNKHKENHEEDIRLNKINISAKT
eukprot:TRINITY_DN23839_c0_g1_i1.p1 TRINITY_DN23839_c0_g1~~TRINITY_DN23839_c0_g1_i1.p1  ORF type:complete len:117 (-),score=22.62 TRINITY_DN23839_c0_g1_i1:10-360(-)